MSIHDLPVVVHATPDDLGLATARAAADTINTAIRERGSARVMLAAAPSQLPTLTALAEQSVDFAHVTFFHMDDYLGLPPHAPQGFGNWLQEHFLDHLGSTTFHRIDTRLPADEAAQRYAEVLGDAPFDLTLCGLGVNAHLAFNDPPADFTDESAVRVVSLDQTSRQQQVDEGHFPDLASVPATALTVTIPRLLRAQHVICSVLGRVKAHAVARTRAEHPTADVPGTALKLHPHAELHVDQEAAHV